MATDPIHTVDPIRPDDQDPAATERRERNRRRRDAEAKAFRRVAFGTTGNPEDDKRNEPAPVAMPMAPLAPLTNRVVTLAETAPLEDATSSRPRP